MRIQIAIPCSNENSVNPRTRESIEKLKVFEDTHAFFIKAYLQCGCSISTNRNMGATFGCQDVDQCASTYKEEYDYLLTVDSDMVFEPYHLAMLLDKNKDVVSAAYEMRDRKECIVAGRFPINSAMNDNCFFSNKMTGCFKADWVGGGFCLIKRDVFRKLTFPFWHEVINYYNHKAELLGDDIGFCRRLKDAGITPYVDMACKVIHDHAWKEDKNISSSNIKKVVNILA